MNDSVVLAQIAHVLGGYGVVLTSAYWGGTKAALISAALLTLYAGLKEFWYDANYELPKQTTFDNVLDFSMYCVGMTIGIVSAFCHG